MVWASGGLGSDVAGVAADFLLNLIAYNLIRSPNLVGA
jgi:hypothetical protein